MFLSWYGAHALHPAPQRREKAKCVIRTWQGSRSAHPLAEPRPKFKYVSGSEPDDMHVQKAAIVSTREREPDEIPQSHDMLSRTAALMVSQRRGSTEQGQQPFIKKLPFQLSPLLFPIHVCAPLLVPDAQLLRGLLHSVSSLGIKVKFILKDSVPYPLPYDT